MKKINKFQTIKMREMRKEGKTLKEVGDAFNVAKSTVLYHTSKKYREKSLKQMVNRFRCLPREKKREKQEKEKGYQKEYHRNRYKNDLEFRKNQIECSINYQKKKREDSMPLIPTHLN